MNTFIVCGKCCQFVGLSLRFAKTVLRIRIRIMLGSGSGTTSKWKAESGSDPHQGEKYNPDPHQSDKVEALEGHFGALEGPNLQKNQWKDPDPHKLEDRVRIRIKVQSWIRLRIKAIRKTALKHIFCAIYRILVVLNCPSLFLEQCVQYGVNSGNSTKTLNLALVQSRFGFAVAELDRLHSLAESITGFTNTGSVYK